MHDLKSPPSESVSEGQTKSNGRNNTSLQQKGLASVLLPLSTSGKEPPEEKIDRGSPRLSLRMHDRFWRTLIFAYWLFGRLLFWHFIARRIIGERVERGNLRRWARYAREFRAFAISMGGVMIKLGQ